MLLYCQGGMWKIDMLISQVYPGFQTNHGSKGDSIKNELFDLMLSASHDQTLVPTKHRQESEPSTLPEIEPKQKKPRNRNSGASTSTMVVVSGSDQPPANYLLQSNPVLIISSPSLICASVRHSTPAILQVKAPHFSPIPDFSGTASNNTHDGRTPATGEDEVMTVVPMQVRDIDNFWGAEREMRATVSEKGKAVPSRTGEKGKRLASSMLAEKSEAAASSLSTIGEMREVVSSETVPQSMADQSSEVATVGNTDETVLTAVNKSTSEHSSMSSMTVGDETSTGITVSMDANIEMTSSEHEGVASTLNSLPSNLPPNTKAKGSSKGAAKAASKYKPDVISEQNLFMGRMIKENPDGLFTEYQSAFSTLSPADRDALKAEVAAK
ncbi:hypothetical protein SCP_0404430 [Sparassis crispa]|uniref:Uncharacterized protein n=1 Tax=Sparassis crispa TaxID=139825 RepID=A0A401GIY6_9APHY|nr:hypothetical protein SCP_0404430 [Sparassis crispa]GBE82065.1 hypothetical protein SCP_0404430 [Sparassis crispa]